MSSLSNDIVRKRQASPPADRNMRRKLQNAGDLALEHLLEDAETHPLFTRNVEQVLDAICDEDVFEQCVRAPLDALMGKVNAREVKNSSHLNHVRQRLVHDWMNRITKLLGETLCDVVDLQGGDSFRVVHELHTARVELKVMPIVQIVETDGQQSKVADEPLGRDNKNDDGDDEAEDDSGVDFPQNSETNLYGTYREADGANDEHNSAEEPMDGGADEHEDNPSEDELDTEARANIDQDQPQQTQATTHVTDQGGHVRWYPHVQDPSLVLLLGEPTFSKHKPSRTLLAQQIQDQITTFGTNNLSHVDRLEVAPYGNKDWTVTFQSASDAVRCSNLQLSLGGKTARLIPFRAARRQVFVCRRFPDDFDVDTAVQRLLTKLPTHRIHVRIGQRNPAEQARSLVIVLERPDEIETMVLTYRSPIRGKSTVIFNVWCRGDACTVCGRTKRKHELPLCKRLSPFLPAAHTHPQLLVQMPRLRE